jgi:hypothetical protein
MGVRDIVPVTGKSRRSMPGYLRWGENVVLTLLTFSVRVRYPLRDGSWSDRQDQRAIPVGAPCH